MFQPITDKQFLALPTERQRQHDQQAEQAQALKYPPSSQVQPPRAGLSK